MQDNKEKFSMPASFEEFSGARREGFIKMKKLKESGAKVVGIYCTYTPFEIIYVAGLVPVSLCSSSDDATRHAEVDLPKNLCPLIKASYGVALKDACPYFYFADLIVGETTCDGKKKMYELMSHIKDIYVLHLPQKNDEASFKLWLSELYKFKAELERRFDVSITDEKLRKAIRMGNEERCNLRRFFELGRLNPLPLSGADIVVYENCSGVREKMELIDENIEPMEAIAKKYLGISCSVMSPNPKRFSELSSLIDEYEVDGVIEVVLQACHTFAIEATSVQKFVTKEKNVPYMYIESDYSMNDSGQVATRIEAFMEII